MLDKEAAVEDETRLLYVEMPRAASQLIMSCEGIRFSPRHQVAAG
jgi:ATP-dependent exoDNAse (exonuclease V) beta subunit